MKIASPIVLAFLFSSLCVFASVPTLNVEQRSGKMNFTIDGVLDEAEWNNAARIANFNNFYKRVPVAESFTEARLCMDSENLYIALDCREPGKVVPGTPEGSNWSCDNTEIFIGCQGPRGRQDSSEEWYIQIILSLNGKRYTEFISEGEYTAAMKYSEKAWCAEVAVPLKKLGPFQDDTLRFNIIRQRTEAKEVLSWCVMQWAHDLNKFGRIILVKDPAAIVHGPWTFGIDHNSAGINWESREAHWAKLFFRQKGEKNFVALSQSSNGGNGETLAASRLHPFFLEGLKPDTEYEYHAGDGVIRSFRTLKAAKSDDFTIAFTSDIHGYDERIRGILDTPQVQNAELLILGGDLVTGCTGRGVCYAGFLDAIVEKWKKPCYFMRGNHEYRGGAPEQFFRLFPLDGGRSAYCSFTYKGIFFLLLDTDGDVVENEVYMQRQRKWMEKVLASREFKEASRAILVVHQPLWARELGGGIQSMELYRMMTPEQRSKFVLSLSGHLHDYARVLPEKNTFHRPAKASVHGRELQEQTPFPALASQCKGFIIVSMREGKLTAISYDDEHREIERIPLR